MGENKVSMLDVQAAKFPAAQHCFNINDQEFEKLKGLLSKAK